MSVVDRVRDLAVPVTSAASMDIYDVEHNGGVIRVLVDCDEGLSIDRIVQVSRALSRTFDQCDLMPSRYTLEVSSPGLERPLRTPDHFQRATGSEVKVKTMPSYDGPRSVSGVLESVDERGIDVRDECGTLRRFGYDEVASARTIFRWASSNRKRSSRSRSNRKSSSR